MLKVHSVLGGPYEYSGEWTLLCQLEEEGLLFVEEVSFASFDDAYRYLTKVEQSVEPLLMEPSRLYMAL